jgi:hypothetical protein
MKEWHSNNGYFFNAGKTISPSSFVLTSNHPFYTSYKKMVRITSIKNAVRAFRRLLQNKNDKTV